MQDLYTCRGCGFLSTIRRNYTAQVDGALLCSACVSMVANGLPLEGSGYVPLDQPRPLPDLLAALRERDDQVHDFTRIDTGLHQRTVGEFQFFIEWLANEVGQTWRDATARLGPRIVLASEVPGTLCLHARWASGSHDQFPIVLSQARQVAAAAY